MSDLEERFRQAAAHLEAPAAAPDAVVRAVQLRRRRHTIAAAASATAVVAMVGALTAVTIGRSGDGRRASVTVDSSASLATPSDNSATQPFPQLAPPPPPESATVPKTFFGAAGAGAERLAIFDTATGHLERYIQAQGSQAMSVFSPDRDVAYQPTFNDSCGSTWESIDLTTGRTQPAFTELGSPDEVAMSQNGRRVAYTSVGPQKTFDGPHGPEPRGCPTATRTLTVLDQTTGQQIAIPVGRGGASAIFPAFDGAGNLLAFKWQGHIRVLDLAKGGGLANATVVPPSPGCNQIEPAFRPGTEQLMVAADCANDAELVGYSMREGEWHQTYRKVVADQSGSFLASFCFDPSGDHLIYSVDIGTTANGAVFVADNGGDRHLTDDVFQVCW